MALSTRDVRILGNKVIDEIFQGRDIGIGEAFMAVRYCAQVVREVREGGIGELKDDILRVVDHVLKRTNIKLLPDFLVDPLVRDGIEVVLGWVADENAAKPGEFKKVLPKELVESAKKVVEKVEESKPKLPPLEDPRDDPTATQEDQVEEASGGASEGEGGDSADDPTLVP